MLPFLACYLTVVVWNTVWIAAYVLRDPHVYRPAEWISLVCQCLMAFFICPVGILLGACSPPSQTSDDHTDMSFQEQ